MGLEVALAEELAAQGVAVESLTLTLFQRESGLRDMAALAIELRTRAPRLPLLTWGPGKLVRRFEQRFPALTDGVFASDEPGAQEALRRWAAALPSPAGS